MITGSVQTKNGKYYAVINLYDNSGKRKPKWICLNLPVRNNKREALKRLHEILNEYNTKNTIDGNVLVSDYLKRWLFQIKSEVRANTYRGYSGNIKNHIIPYFEKKKINLNELKARHLEDYYSYTLQKGLSATTIKHHHQNISKALNDAVHNEVLKYNVAKNARTPKVEKFKAKFLSQEQTKQLLKLFKGSTIELPVILATYSGMRRSEVLGLKWSYVDLDNNTITVAETLQQNTGGSYTDKPKTDSSYRTLPINDEIRAILIAQKQRQAEYGKLLGDKYEVSDYVCTLLNGKAIQPNYLTKQFHKLIATSDLPNIRFHDLRHSVASNLIACGISVVEVAEWLGHSSSTTTLDFYAHADLNSKLLIAKQMQSIMTNDST